MKQTKKDLMSYCNFDTCNLFISKLPRAFETANKGNGMPCVYQFKVQYLS